MVDVNGVEGELAEKARECTTEDELSSLAEANGSELAEDQLDAVAGGILMPDLGCKRDRGCDEYLCTEVFL